MKQYARREFVKLVRQNGFKYVRSKGGHDIYYNNKGRHVSIPQTLVNVIARRLIKENNLIK
jgi:predicted RNA binding protein YcfA (HicA-like mRNA interferase family)